MAGAAAGMPKVVQVLDVINSDVDELDLRFGITEDGDIVGEVHSHGATQPCIQAKSTRHPRGGVGPSPTIFFIFFLFFSCKNHLIQVKDSQ